MRLATAAITTGSVLLSLGAVIAACSTNFSRGKCDAGYFEIGGKCVLVVGMACRRNGDCLSSHCLLLQAEKGFCTIPCQTHMDCPKDYRCDQELGMFCVPGKPGEKCQSDKDCQPCQTCIQGVCLAESKCQPCAKDEDCGACQRCLEGKCVDIAGCQKCQSDIDCPACQSCSENVCQPISGCIRCTADDQCPGCKFCSMGVCRDIAGCGTSPCFNDTDCPQRTRCLYNRLLGLNVCLPVGLADGADCSAGGDPTCASGLCLGDQNGKFFCTKPCQQDGDCPWPDRCGYGIDCRLGCLFVSSPAPTTSCGRNLDCGQGQVCSLYPKPLEQKWEARCFASEACGAKDGQACRESARCYSRICQPQGLCTPVCRGALDCPQQFTCLQMALKLSDTGEPKPFLGCAPLGPGIENIGEYCGENQDCAGQKCLAFVPFGSKRCTKNCRAGYGDCPDGFLCLPAPDGSLEDVCTPAELSASCRRDGDCAPQEICVLSGSLSLSFACAKEAGGAAAGEPCQKHQDCKSAVCLAQGFCSAACLDNSDCPPDFICDLQELATAEGKRVFARLCTPADSFLRCWTDADCPAGESCRLRHFSVGPGPEGRCRKNYQGAGPGEACSGPFGCLQGVCAEAGVCAPLCVTDSDCPAGFECRAGSGWLGWAGAASEKISLALCLDIARELGKRCPSGDSDCAEGLFCFDFPGQGPYCTKECVNVYSCQPDGIGFVCESDGSGRLLCRPN